MAAPMPPTEEEIQRAAGEFAANPLEILDAPPAEGTAPPAEDTAPPEAEIHPPPADDSVEPPPPQVFRRRRPEAKGKAHAKSAAPMAQTKMMSQASLRPALRPTLQTQMSLQANLRLALRPRLQWTCSHVS